MRLLDRSPFREESSVVAFRDERIRVKSDQIILWVMITNKSMKAPNPSALPFPVILDTGFSHSFSIRQHQLQQWAGIQQEDMSRMGRLRDRDQYVTLCAANVWVHCNAPGAREYVSGQLPYNLATPKGIGIYPGDFPRLPILGLRAIADNKLVLKIDGAKREATLRTKANWLWPFL